MPETENLNERYAAIDKEAYRFKAIIALPLFGVFPLFTLVLIVCARTWLLLYADDVLLLMFCGMLWISYPGCAFVSVAMCACPPASVVSEQEARPPLQSARVMYKKYASSLLIAGIAFSIGLFLKSGSHTLLLAWHNLQAGRSWFGPLYMPLMFFAATIIGLFLLNVACRAGASWGERIRREHNSRSGRFLDRCWSWRGRTRRT